MYESVDKILEESKNKVKEFQKESDIFIEKLEKEADKLDEKSVQNFANWRDYLHKYYTVILAFIAGSGILNSTTNLQNPYIQFGIYLSLEGIIAGFLIINIYFYFERKWFQITSYITQTKPYKLYDHPDVKNNIVEAMKLNVKQAIKENKIKLQEAKKNKDKKEVKFLKQAIKADKEFVRLLKYYGTQFGLIEKAWVTTIFMSLILTIVGVIIIFNKIS